MPNEITHADTITTVIDPPQADTPPVDATPQTEQAQFPAADPVEPPAFDPTPFEEEFGLGAGSLKDAKSVDDVLARIAASPFDNLGLEGDDADDADPFQQPALATEVEQLRQQLAERDSYISSLQSQLESQLAAQRQELSRRLDAAIDRLASPKYGVGRNRTLKQLEAANALRNKVAKLVNAFAQTGEELGPIESIVARVREIDDDTHKPAAQKPVNREQVLGAPGTSRQSKVGDSGPRNIHSVVTSW